MADSKGYLFRLSILVVSLSSETLLVKHKRIHRCMRMRMLAGNSAWVSVLVWVGVGLALWVYMCT